MKSSSRARTARANPRTTIVVTGAPASWRLSALALRFVRVLEKGGWGMMRSSIALSVTCVDAKEMARLNRHYCGKARPTDVLSFEQPASAFIEKARGAPVCLGDVVLCRDVVRRQAREQGHGVRVELAALLAHGLMHLLGHDHERSSRAAAAQARAETRLIRAAGLSRLVKSGLIERARFDKGETL